MKSSLVVVLINNYGQMMMCLCSRI